MSMLLALYGITPAPALSDSAIAVVTTEQGTTTISLPVRRDPDCPHRKQVQTPCKHHEWNVLLWHEYAGCYEPIHCYDCVITINACSQQPAPAAVATPEPVAQVAAEVQVEHIEVSEPATPMDEQDVLIAELAFEADAVVDRERYFAARSGKYVLLHLRTSGLAVNCSCPDRVKKGRFQGRCCKHMQAHNAMLQPAVSNIKENTKMRDTSERFVNDIAEKDTTCAACHLPITKGDAVIHDNLTDQEAHRVCPPLQSSIDAILDREAA